HLCDFLNFSEELANSFATGERLRHRGLFLAKPVGSGSAFRNSRKSGCPDCVISRCTSRTDPDRCWTQGSPDRHPAPDRRDRGVNTGRANTSRPLQIGCPADPPNDLNSAGRTSCEHRGDPGAKTPESPILYWVTSTRPWRRPSPEWP